MKNEKMFMEQYVRIREESKALKRENADLRETQETLEAAIIENYEEAANNTDAIMELYENMA